MAKLITEAIEFPGFSFLHVMSQCITFCPEQTHWKAIVHEREQPALSNADEAARLFLHEGGFQTGLLYAKQRPTWPATLPPRSSEGAVDQLSAAFRV
jgi:2-oxoglutarate ferredoxin oxidoreductase subunit beta